MKINFFSYFISSRCIFSRLLYLNIKFDQKISIQSIIKSGKIMIANATIYNHYFLYLNTPTHVYFLFYFIIFIRKKEDYEIANNRKIICKGYIFIC